MEDKQEQIQDITFENIIGKVILIGITKMKHNEVVELIQYHGTIVFARENDKICIKQDDGTLRSIPPLLTNITNAKPGEYREKSTGKIITNPDFISTWIIDMPE